VEILNEFFSIILSPEILEKSISLVVPRAYIWFSNNIRFFIINENILSKKKNWGEEALLKLVRQDYNSPNPTK
jgi:hypothetical protein